MTAGFGDVFRCLNAFITMSELGPTHQDALARAGVEAELQRMTDRNAAQAAQSGGMEIVMARDQSALGALHRRDTTYAWYVTFVMCLCFTCSYMDRSILPLLVGPLERSLGLTDTTISLLQGAAFAVFYALFGLPLARVADNGNRRNLILAGVIAWSVATIGCGLARTIPELFLGRICVAIGEAVLAPAAVSIISDYFSAGFRARSLSIYSMGTYFGGGLALELGGTLLRVMGAKSALMTPIGPLESWRIVFITLGLSGVLLIPLLLGVKEPQRLNESGGAAGEQHTLREVLAEFGRKRAALFTCIIGFATIALGGQSLQTWAPTLFVRMHGWNLGGAGQRLGVFTLVLGPLGAIVGAVLAERLERAGRTDGKLVVGVISASGCVVMALMAAAPSEAMAFVGVVGMVFIVAFNFGIVQATMAELLPNRMRAIAAACYIASSNLLGLTLGPLMVGLLTEKVFHDPHMIAVSIRIVSPIAFLVAATILFSGRKAYRDAVKGPAEPALAPFRVA